MLFSQLVGVLGLDARLLLKAQNGCGRKNLGFFVPDLLNGRACREHDLMYSFGQDDELKELADDLLAQRIRPHFLQNVVKDVLRLVDISVTPDYPLTNDVTLAQIRSFIKEYCVNQLRREQKR